MAKKPTLAKKKTAEVPTFVWEGVDKRNKRVKGEMRGPDPNLVKAELRRQGITPMRVRKKSKSISFGETISAKDIMLFTRQLHTMLNAGIAIVQALDMLAYSNKKIK